MESQNLETNLSLDINQNLLSPWMRASKRALDIVLVLAISPLVLPILGFVALLVWLDSRSDVLYQQERIGKGGFIFKIWKFCTMIPDNEQALKEYFQQHPELRGKWEANRKLENDPRVTPLGRVLRRFSLDELPQLWNVIIGEMSLIGPRPMLEDEIQLFGDVFEFYRLVRPGITGLWQVSGRNNVSFEERVQFDRIYLCNWSIWLDIQILLRTIGVVLKGDGAY